MRRIVALLWMLALAPPASLTGCGESPGERPCESHADCTLPARCGSAGRCEVPPASADGTPCFHGAHCKSGLCLHPTAGTASAEEGICATPCASPAPCTDGTRCMPLHALALPPAPSDEPALGLYCQLAGKGSRHLAEPCADHDSCASGICGEDGERRCTQPCEDSCPDRLVCRKSSFAVAGAKLETALCAIDYLQTIELGKVLVPLEGLAAPLTIDIPAGVTSLLLLADDLDDLRVVIDRLEAPDGTVLVNHEDESLATSRAFDYLGTATVQLPGSDEPKAVVQAGSYKLWLRLYEPRFDQLVPVSGEVERVAALWRNAAHPTVGGLLDLDIHLAPGTALTAATALDDPYLKDAIAELSTLLEREANIGLGSLRFFDLPADVDVIDSATKTRELRVAHSQSGPHGLTASVFIVKDISYGFKAVAGGIPSVPGLAGRPISGVVAEKQGTGKTMGKLLAHELGHFLGLWHTTEQGAAGYDKLADTPECVSGTQLADCPDRQNLMFPWYLDSPEPLSFSAGQAAVLAQSPFLYAHVYPLACGPDSDPVRALESPNRSAFDGLAGAADRLAGSCGGQGKRERVHLHRLETSGLASLEIDVFSPDFAPEVYVLKDRCDAAASELLCAVGKVDEVLTLSLPAPAPGAYYIVVDGGPSNEPHLRYRLHVRSGAL